MEQVNILGVNDGTLDIVLSGDIDLSNADGFYAAVTQSYKATPADVCFHCEKLAFIDSTTLGTFVKILKTLKENGHKMRLVALQPKIKKLFLICALDSIIEIA